MLLRQWFSAHLILVVLLASCSAPSPPKDQAPGPTLKIFISAAGIYQIDAGQLEAAGWPVENVDFDQIALLYRGRIQPYWTEGQGGDAVLRFYAQDVRSRYTAQNVYWLVDKRSSGQFTVGEMGDAEPATSAIDLARTDVGVSHGSNTYMAVQRLEENAIYAPQVEDREPWFWLSLPAPTSQQFYIELDELVPGSGQITISVWGSTEAPQAPDHHLRIAINDQQVADEYWDGKGAKLIQVEAPSGILRDGMNKLTLESPGDTGVAADIVLLDQVSLEYPRRLVAVSDYLEFVSSGGKHRLEGFGGPIQVYDVTAPESGQRLEDLKIDSNAIEFEGQRDHRYIAVGPAGHLTPDSLSSALLTPDLINSDLEADYLAIGPRDLLDALQPLLAHRESQGYKPLAVPVEAVYDQFGSGTAGPDAVRDFLRYARNNWKIAPAYALLAGDWTYDPKGYLGSNEANRLPAFLVHTRYGGETASDVLFAQLDDDAWPDIAVGRIPAQTPQQVQVWVEKLLDYEQTAANADLNAPILAVADGQERTFERDAQGFLDRFPEGVEKLLISPEAGTIGANLEITQRINAGSSLVAYFGHGSVSMWGKDRLFTVEDVSALSNQGIYPVFLNMTCLTGLFTHPEIDSLAETLLWQPRAGAVAVLAPTSLTLATDQSFLSNAFVDAYLAEPSRPIGDVLLEARRQIPESLGGAQDVLQTFLLFGDPAMRLKQP
jgi:hypothetical protein